MSEELNVTDAEGGWRAVTADDVSAMMSELASLRRELNEARRLLDDARAQKPGDWKPLPLRTPAPVPAQPAALPAGWRVLDDGHRVTVCWDGAGYTLDDRHGPIEEAFCGFVRDVVKSAAARPQPAAVPEAVAKDAAAILVQALEEIAWQRPLGVRPSKSGEAMERAAIIALHKYNAILSAADTEVKP